MYNSTLCGFAVVVRDEKGEVVPPRAFFENASDAERFDVNGHFDDGGDDKKTLGLFVIDVHKTRVGGEKEIRAAARREGEKPLTPREKDGLLPDCQGFTTGRDDHGDVIESAERIRRRLLDQEIGVVRFPIVFEADEPTMTVVFIPSLVRFVGVVELDRYEFKR